MKESIVSVFHVDIPILGMLHLRGGYPEQVHEQAKQEIEAYYENRADAVLVEDYFGTQSDVEWALDYLKLNYTEQVYGVNLLGDPERAFALAWHYDAAFVQIDSVCGHLKPGFNTYDPYQTNLKDKTHDSDYAQRLSELRTKYPLFLLGGVRFKYQPVRSGRSLEEDLKLGKERCNAVVVTGAGTGIDTDMGKIRRFRDALGNFPLFVGAGLTVESCEEQLMVADGAIVGSWFKKDGKTDNLVDPERVRRFMRVVKEVRKKRMEKIAR